MEDKDFISKKIRTRFKFKKYLDILKRKIRESKEEDEKDVYFISAFLLSIFLLESRLKTILFWKDGIKNYNRNQKKFKSLSFGKVINKFKEFIKKQKSKLTDIFKESKILSYKNLSFFIKYCEEVNRIRNELIHHVATSCSRHNYLTGIEEILTKIKKEFIGEGTEEFYKEILSHSNSKENLGEILNSNPFLKGAKLDILLIIAEEISSLQIQKEIKKLKFRRS